MMPAPRIVVAGGGPAGLAAAAAAARLGASVRLFEENEQPGGQLRYRVQPVDVGQGAPAERPERLAERLVDEAMAAGAALQTGTLVAGWYGGDQVLVVEPGGTRTIPPDAFIVTTGSTDLPFPFAGATYPGVFSRRAVQILLNQHRVLPGRRFAIIGTGAEAEELAIDLLLAGGETVWSGLAPAHLMRAEGEDGVRGLTVAGDSFGVDVIAIAVGRQADAALATMAGVPLGFAPELGGWIAATDDRLQCPDKRIFVAGDAAGTGSVAVALAEGRLAGVAAAAALGLADDEAVSRARDEGGSELAWRSEIRAGLQPLHVQPYDSGAA
jgi:thioredoxin reductase